MDLRDEFGIDLVLHHVTEGHMMAEEIAERGVPCAVGPIAYTRRGLELANLTLACPGILARAGVKVALISDFPTFPPHYLPIHAGMAFREGMRYEDALGSITINAASILGVSDRVGSLEPGKDADLVVFDGDPLGVLSKARMVLSDGEIVFDAERSCTAETARAGKEDAR
jgi:imidazolonepropionase-like amidohydrolase